MTLHEYLERQGRGAVTRLAAALGTSKGYIVDLRDGNRMPSVRFARRLEEATDGQVLATELLGLTEQGVAGRKGSVRRRAVRSASRPPAAAEPVNRCSRGRASAQLELELPLPPSSNSLYPGRQRRRKSDEYKGWLAAAGWEIRQQRPRAVSGPYVLRMRVPAAMPGDVSNRIKAVEDLLVSHRLTPDDRLAVAVEVARAEDVPRGRCRVIVEPAARE